jgi:hypothetical protein
LEGVVGDLLIHVVNITGVVGNSGYGVRLGGGIGVVAGIGFYGDVAGVVV